ncbi:hypothetical protein A3L09_04060 [Thermococcus profundus]|uniref:Uncharacterized protein n=1 Tax=Thermococcus profundus TaxID=49899 RepID=A0A2Z2M9R1_THEPR|nr:hypothetical protein [Thermococcus profundus]ASJ02486.1 hypothetical protein A3L09_04060 [Thermococcus profundus]
MLLTRHARERLIKRLAKRRSSERVYRALWDFLDRSKKLMINDEVVIFTDGRKSLVCVKLPCERLPLEEIRTRVRGISEPYECVFPDGKLGKTTVPSKFLEMIPDGIYCFYLNREKRSLYVGSESPLLAVTLRPAKRWERDS